MAWPKLDPKDLPPINPPKKAGRPTKYTDELGIEACAMVSQGISLRRICEMKHMPALQNLMIWLHKYDIFRERYERACQDKAEVFADETIPIADEATNKDNAHAIDVRVRARQWYASKLQPKKYGDTRLLEQGSGAPTLNIFITPAPGDAMINVTPAHKQLDDKDSD